MILLLDNTVLSNFALVHRLELLPRALGNQIAAPTQVTAEYDEGVRRGILPATEWDWLQGATPPAPHRQSKGVNQWPNP
jgi:predicted nucleic acid-binding protein